MSRLPPTSPLLRFSFLVLFLHNIAIQTRPSIMYFNFNLISSDTSVFVKYSYSSLSAVATTHIELKRKRKRKRRERGRGRGRGRSKSKLFRERQQLSSTTNSRKWDVDDENGDDIEPTIITFRHPIRNITSISLFNVLSSA